MLFACFSQRNLRKNFASFAPSRDSNSPKRKRSTIDTLFCALNTRGNEKANQLKPSVVHLSARIYTTGI